MRHILFGGILFLALLLPLASGQVCSTHTSSGWQTDYDCDSVPDSRDNCPWLANSRQDDMNRNGVGDLCDMMIEHVSVQPDTKLKQGDFAKLSVSIINNREGPVEDVSVRLKANSLDTSIHQNVEEIPSQGTATLDFWLRVPKCAKTGAHDVQITSVFKNPLSKRTITEVFQQELRVEAGRCGEPDGPLDTTIIDVIGNIDLDRGERAIIPIKITNMGPQTTYHLATTLREWRIDPSASMQLPSGHDGTLYLSFDTDDMEAGTHEFVVLVTSEDQQTGIPMKLYVRAPYEETKQGGTLLFRLLLVIVVMLIVGILLLVVLLHLTRRHRAHSEAKSQKKRSTKKRAPKRKKVAVEKVKGQKRETYY